MKRIINKVSKMPCYSFNHGACRIGSKLRKINGSVCSDCYACKGFYPLHKDKHIAKTSLLNDLSKFKQDLIQDIIDNERSGYFRYHDKGDIISLEHLHAIVDIAISLPNIMFWLPTKEIRIVRDYLKAGYKIPNNLIIRISKYLVNRNIPLPGLLKNIPYSTVYDHDHALPKNASECIPINNKCDTCRKCWNKTIRNITYIKH